MNLVEGAHYSEAADGTNGIGTALAADRAFQVFAFEHFNERHHQWICSGAPVHDPVSGKTIGLIDLSSLWKVAHPRSLELVSTAARTIEQRLLEVRRDQDGRLRRRYGDLMTRSSDLLVNRDGYVLAGAEREHSKTLDVPEGGGEVVLGDGSIAAAASLGQGEAYLLRRVAAYYARSAPVEVLDRAEKHVRELVTEQAALRQVATLVARDSAPDQVFGAVAEQVARVFDVPHVRLVRYEPDGSVVVGGSRESDREPFPIGSRWPLDSPGVVATVRQTGRSARLESYAHMTGEIAAVARGVGMRSAVASPIVVERRLWGAMVVLSPRHEGFAEDAEARLTDFTELVATAIANAESREALGRLAEEQAALRRVATLVARDASSTEVFESVATEVGKLLDTDITVVGRYDGDGAATAIGSWSASGGGVPVGTRSALGGHNVLTIVAETGEPARVEGYAEATGEAAEIARRYGWRSSIAAPIVVEGRVWGVMLVSTQRPEPFPAGAEGRLAVFTDLVATAVGNAQAYDELRRFGEEQATLRRIATLVAKGVQPEEVFAAVTEEVAATFGAITDMMRFEHDRPGVVLVGVSKEIEEIDIPIGSRWDLDDALAAGRVYRTGRSARVGRADWSSVKGAIGEAARRLGVVSTVACPINVEGSLWGVITVSAREELATETEQRLEKFIDLVTTAIANAEGKSELAASRRRIVAASDETRRRIERNLHDGTQQRLVSLGLAVRAAEASLPPGRNDLRDQLSGVAAGLIAAVEDLQEISRGIHPAILSKGGLAPALRALAHRSAIPVDLEIATEGRLAEPIEVAAYFVASEALANAAKHSQASRIDVLLELRERSLLLSVRDDGVGGADTAHGSGLVGLTDRVDALGGSIRIQSRPGKGTQITTELPLELELPQPVG
jgi:signal transduction histidine kinase/putative methionine-R-sulfoxide reductase with GAF domain